MAAVVVAIVLLLVRGSGGADRVSGAATLTVEVQPGAGEGETSPVRTGGAVTGPRVDGPLPDRLRVDGVALRRAAGEPFTGASLEPGRSGVLLVYAGAEREDPYCNPPVRVQVLAQDAASVTLDAAQYKPVDRPQQQVSCTAEGLAPKQRRLDLGVALAGRRLLDRTGSVHPVLDPDTLLVPTRLPAGYRLPGSLTVDSRAVDDTTNAVTVYTFAGPDPRTQLELYQGAAGKVPGNDEPTASSPMVDRPTVRGHPALVTSTKGLKDLTCLRWHERADTVVMICNRGYPPPLGSPELQQVAAALERPADR